MARFVSLMRIAKMKGQRQKVIGMIRVRVSLRMNSLNLVSGSIWRILYPIDGSFGFFRLVTYECPVCRRLAYLKGNGTRRYSDRRLSVD